MMNSFNVIGIVGSGKMGMDIFNFFEDRNLKVRLICENQDICVGKHKSYRKKIERKLKNAIIDSDLAHKKESDVLFSWGTDVLSDCDLIIEAVPEVISLKKYIFTEISKVVSPETVLATNTSSIDISAIFSSINHMERCIALHFFYPVKLKNIIEIVTLDSTSNKVTKRIQKFLTSLGRNYITLPNYQRFILNRILLDVQALAYWFYSNEKIPFKIIDNVTKEYLFPVGIFELLDSVGLDIILESVKNYAKMGPNELYLIFIDCIETFVMGNRLGVKSGSGFYNYKSEDSQSHESEYNTVFVMEGLRAAYINSTLGFLERKICTDSEIDLAFREYMGIDIGPVELAKQVGYANIISDLQKLLDKTGYDIFRPSSILQNDRIHG